MTSIRSLKDIQGLSWQGSDLIESITDRLQVFIFSYSHELQALTTWSSNCKNILGISDQEVIASGNIFLKHTHKDDRFKLLQKLETCINSKSSMTTCYRWIKPDNNQLIWLYCSCNFVKRNELEYLDGILIDISDQISDSLNNLLPADSLTNYIESKKEAVLILDEDNSIIFFNKLFEEQLGNIDINHKKLVIGSNFWQLFDAQSTLSLLKETCQKVIKQEIPKYNTRLYLNQEHYLIEILPVIKNDLCQSLILSIKNINEVVKQELELEDLRHKNSNKIIMSGIAHNFNNTLQSIIGHAIALQNHSDNKKLVKDSSNSIIELVNSASDLTRQLFQVEQAVIEESSPFDLNLAILSAINKTGNLFSNKIKITVTLGQLKPAFTIQKFFQEGLENLLGYLSKRLEDEQFIHIKSAMNYKNAKNTKPKENNIKLSITFEKSILSDHIKVLSKQPTTNNWIATNLPDAIDTSLFEIFKRLDLKYHIKQVNSINHEIELEIPIDPKATINKSQKENNKLNQKKNPSILIVDDDQMVLETVSSMVRDLGFECVTASNGSSALKELKKHKKSIKLAFVDAILPEQNGIEITKNLLKVNKFLEVIAFTGAGPDMSKQMLNAGASTVLCKPVGIKEIRQALNKIKSTTIAA